MQTVINVAWTLADAVIIATFVRFGRREFPDFVTPVMFRVGAGGLFALAYARTHPRTLRPFTATGGPGGRG